MPFPGASDSKPVVKKGKSRSRRYVVSWCYREEPSNNDATLYTSEVRSTNIQSAVTALLRDLNTGDDEKLRKSDLVVVEVRVLARGEALPEEAE